MALLLPNVSLTGSLMLRLEVNSRVEYKNFPKIVLNDEVLEKRKQSLTRGEKKSKLKIEYCSSSPFRQVNLCYDRHSLQCHIK